MTIFIHTSLCQVPVQDFILLLMFCSLITPVRTLMQNYMICYSLLAINDPCIPGSNELLLYCYMGYPYNCYHTTLHFSCSSICLPPPFKKEKEKSTNCYSAGFPPPLF